MVRLALEDEKTAGGIIIPETARQQLTYGEVMAVGPGRRHDDGTVHPIAASICVGVTVLFRKYGGTDASFLGRDVRLVGEQDVLAVLQRVES